MKNILLGILTFAFVLPINAATTEEYFCKDAYTEKLSRIEHKRTMRSLGKFGFVAGSAVGGLFLPTLWLGPIGVVSGAFVTAPMLGMSGNYFFNEIIDREAGLLLAQDLFSLSKKNKEELKLELYGKYIKDKQSYLRKNDGSKFTANEVRKLYPLETLKLESLVDVSLKKVNHKRNKNGTSELSYTDLQELINKLNDADSFCPTKNNGKRRPKTINEVIKVLVKN